MWLRLKADQHKGLAGRRRYATTTTTTAKTGGKQQSRSEKEHKILLLSPGLLTDHTSSSSLGQGSFFFKARYQHEQPTSVQIINQRTQTTETNENRNSSLLIQIFLFVVTK